MTLDFSSKKEDEGIEDIIYNSISIIVEAPTSTKNESGMIHTVTATVANVHYILQTHKFFRKDDKIIYWDTEYLGIENRKEIKNDECLRGDDSYTENGFVKNPTGALTGTKRVRRGGSCDAESKNMIVGLCNEWVPAKEFHNLGLRPVFRSEESISPMPGESNSKTYKVGEVSFTVKDIKAV